MADTSFMPAPEERRRRGARGGLLDLRETLGTLAGFLGRKRQDAPSSAEANAIERPDVPLEPADRPLRERSAVTLAILSATVDARDAYTAGHSRRVRSLCVAIGRELGLSRTELELLGYAALFHDVGKLAVPDAILLRPASLSEAEWALMRRHAEEGARLIERHGLLADAVPLVRHHHERYDGTGYPDGLAGEEIPLGARIVHVADALDSMVTTRIYRSAKSVEAALVELEDGSGTQFCPRCVAALDRVLESDAFDELELPVEQLAAIS